MTRQMLINGLQQHKQDVLSRMDDTHAHDMVIDYDRGYICDCVEEYADSATSIYYADSFKWLTECADDAAGYCEEYINDYLDPRSGNIDFYQILRGGEYLQIKAELYDNIDNICEYYLTSAIITYLAELASDVYAFCNLADDAVDTLVDIIIDTITNGIVDHNDEIDVLDYVASDIIEKMINGGKNND